MGRGNAAKRWWARQSAHEPPGNPVKRGHGIGGRDFLPAEEMSDRPMHFPPRLPDWLILRGRSVGGGCLIRPARSEAARSDPRRGRRGPGSTETPASPEACKGYFLVGPASRGPLSTPGPFWSWKRNFLPSTKITSDGRIRRT